MFTVIRTWLLKLQLYGCDYIGKLAEVHAPNNNDDALANPVHTFALVTRTFPVTQLISSFVAR